MMKVVLSLAVLSLASSSALEANGVMLRKAPIFDQREEEEDGTHRSLQVATLNCCGTTISFTLPCNTITCADNIARACVQAWWNLRE